MNLVEIDRLDMMRKRQAYFSAIAAEYTSFADFIQTQDMWLAIREPWMGFSTTPPEYYVGNCLVNMIHNRHEMDKYVKLQKQKIQ